MANVGTDQTAMPSGRRIIGAVAVLVDRYKAHLSAQYGEECVATISVALQDINNAIGHEEK
jgi:hypothetical protein